MFGSILCQVVRGAAQAAAPTLGRKVAEEALKAAAMTAGTMAIYGAARLVRDQYERRQRETLPQLQNQNSRWI